MSIFAMSKSASIFIIAIIILRALIMNKLPKRTFVILWCIVLVRLFLPVTFSSPVSANRVLERIVADSMNITNVSTGGTPLYMYVWTAGAIACGAFYLASYVRYRLKFRLSLPVQDTFVTSWMNEHTLKRRLQIRYSDRVGAPLTYGLLRPVILLPKDIVWDDTKQMQHILNHELVHIKRFDVLVKLFLTVAICIHWFNPLVWVMYILANRDIEISCDERVVWDLGTEKKKAYALTLIGFEEKKSSHMPLCNNFSKNAMEERIGAIMRIKKVSIAGIVLAAFLVFSATVVFASDFSETSWGAGEQTVSTDTMETQVSIYDDANLVTDTAMEGETVQRIEGVDETVYDDDNVSSTQVISDMMEETTVISE